MILHPDLKCCQLRNMRDGLATCSLKLYKVLCKAGITESANVHITIHCMVEYMKGRPHAVRFKEW